MHNACHKVKTILPNTAQLLYRSFSEYLLPIWSVQGPVLATFYCSQVLTLTL